VSVATNPQLLADYTAGRITYAEYQAAMRSAQAVDDLQKTAAQLQNHVLLSESRGYSTCNDPEQARQLAYSELALKQESTRLTLEKIQRDLQEEQARAAEAERIRDLYYTVDSSRGAAGSCNPTAGATAALTAAQATLKAEQDAVGQARYERQKVEDYRQAVIRNPMDWQSLPAEQQGVTIATELAARRAQLATELGDQIASPNPAYIDAPMLLPEDPSDPWSVQVPDLLTGYSPADPISSDQVTVPVNVINPDTWPEIGSDGATYTEPGGGSYNPGGSGSGGSDGGGSDPTQPAGTDPTSSPSEEDPMDNGNGQQVLQWLDLITDYITEGGTISTGPGLTDPTITPGQHQQTTSATTWLLIGGGFLLVLMMLK